MFLNSLVFAASIAVRGFDSGNALFLEIPDLHPDPDDLSLWVLTDEAKGSCTRVNSDWARRSTEQGGISISDFYADRVYFLTWDGHTYSREQAGQTWTPGDDGAWLPASDWTQNAWVSPEVQFLKDPRPAHAGRWYQLGPALSCHIFNEASRSVGPAGVLTVSLSSGNADLPAWTLATGQASLGAITHVGNWLP